MKTEEEVNPSLGAMFKNDNKHAINKKEQEEDVNPSVGAQFSTKFVQKKKDEDENVNPSLGATF